MKNVLTIAVNVIKDTARKKLFYVVFLFGIAIITLSPLLPSFELGAKLQFLRDVSLSLTSLFGVVLAVIISVGQIPAEVDKKTIYNILSKPVSRIQYLLGKYLGILAALAIILFVMGVEVVLLIVIRLGTFSPVVFQGILAVFLECAVISAFCVCLSTFTTIPVNVFATILFYLLCHVKTGFLHEKLVLGTKGVLKALAWAVYYVIPNLENFNIAEEVGYGKGVATWYMLRVSGYALLFVVVFLAIGYLFFRRKNL